MIRNILALLFHVLGHVVVIHVCMRFSQLMLLSVVSLSLYTCSSVLVLDVCVSPLMCLCPHSLFLVLFLDSGSFDGLVCLYTPLNIL